MTTEKKPFSEKPGRPAERPYGVAEHVRLFMLELGYIHETDLQEATSTSPRTRARWRPPRGLLFGNEKWYALDEVKRHLEARAAEGDPEEDLVSL